MRPERLAARLLPLVILPLLLTSQSNAEAPQGFAAVARSPFFDRSLRQAHLPAKAETALLAVYQKATGNASNAGTVTIRDIARLRSAQMSGIPEAREIWAAYLLRHGWWRGLGITDGEIARATGAHVVKPESEPSAWAEKVEPPSVALDSTWIENLGISQKLAQGLQAVDIDTVGQLKSLSVAKAARARRAVGESSWAELGSAMAANGLSLPRTELELAAGVDDILLRDSSLSVAAQEFLAFCWSRRFPSDRKSLEHLTLGDLRGLSYETLESAERAPGTRQKNVRESILEEIRAYHETRVERFGRLTLADTPALSQAKLPLFAPSIPVPAEPGLGQPALPQALRHLRPEASLSELGLDPILMRALEGLLIETAGEAADFAFVLARLNRAGDLELEEVGGEGGEASKLSEAGAPVALSAREWVGSAERQQIFLLQRTLAEALAQGQAKRISLDQQLAPPIFRSPPSQCAGFFAVPSR